MTRLNIKPLSQNDAWRGRRFKSDAYKGFTKEVGYELNKIKIVIPEGKLQINYKFGFSSNGSDLDNPTKSLQDLLSAKYKFNDNRVWRIIIEKEIVEKGKEFMEFSIIPYL